MHLISLICFASMALAAGRQTVQQQILAHDAGHSADKGAAVSDHFSFPRRGVVRCHTRPVYYRDAEGKRQPINMALVDKGAQGVECLANSVGFVARPDGKTTEYRVGKNTITMVLQNKGRQGAASAKARGAGSVEFAGVLDGVTIAHEMDYGRVKEFVVLDTAPRTGYAKSYTLTWAWAADGLTPELDEGGAILWRDADGDVPVRCPAPTAWDANGKPIQADYALTGNRLSIEVPSARLAEAAYPVTIDPTVETDDATLGCAIYEDDDDDYIYSALIKIPLPDLTGFEEITTATLNFWTVRSVNWGIGVDLYCEVKSWTGSENASTLAALFNGETRTAEITSTLGSQYNQHNVVGGVGYGIIGIYDADASPDPCTVFIDYDDGGNKTDGKQGPSISVYVGDEASNNETQIYTTATHPAYIEIEYTGGGGGETRQPRGSGTVGVLQP